MAASQSHISSSSGPRPQVECQSSRGVSSRSSRFVCSSSCSQQQQGVEWLHRAAAASRIRAVPQHNSTLPDVQQQWAPYNDAAEQQQLLHNMVYREQQAAVQQRQQSAGHHQPQHLQLKPQQQQQQQQMKGLAPPPAAPSGSRRHQRQLQEAGPGRASRGNRSWQWLASQLELGSNAVPLPEVVDCLQQLGLPGVGPSAADRAQPHYSSFVTRLLLLLQQHLQAALQQYEQQQQQQCELAVPLDQVSKVLWALGKLQLRPDWQSLEQQQQQQSQYVHGAPFHMQQHQRAQIQQRSAAAITSAAQLVQLHLQLAQSQHQQQGQGPSQQQPWSDPASQVQLNPKLLSQCIWGLAKLKYPASDSFLQLFLSVSQPLLSECSCRELSSVAWALGQLHCQPGNEWAAAFLNAAAASIAAGSGSAPSGAQQGQPAPPVAALLLSTAEMQLLPQEGWVQFVLSRVTGATEQQQRRQQQQQEEEEEGLPVQGLLLRQMDGRSLASLLGALAKWGFVPDRACFQQLQLAVLQQLPGCNGLDTAQLLWALASIAAAAPAVALGVDVVGSSGSRGRGNSSWAPASHTQQTQVAGSSEAGSQQQPQQQQKEEEEEEAADTLLLHPAVLQGLTSRLAATVQQTPPSLVVLGMWGAAKLHALSRPMPQQQQARQQQQQQQAQQQQQVQEQRQDRQHWHACRQVTVHCLSHLHSQGLIGELSAHSLAVLAWALVLAGGGAPEHFNASQQPQQPQQQPASKSGPNSSSGSSSSSGGNGSWRHVGMTVPTEFLQQLLGVSRYALQAASPHSQALLLSALVHLRVKPSWQWLLGFCEATEPCLDCCSPQDLSMMAKGLVCLQAKPLSSWLGRFLEASQGLMQRASPAQQPQQQLEGADRRALSAARAFPVDCLARVLAAVADPVWGLVPDPAAAGADSSSSRGVLVPADWMAVAQQHMLLLLPELRPSEVAVLLRCAVKLGWCDTSGSSSSAGGAAAVTGLLQTAVGSRDGVQQQQLQAAAGSAAANATGLLQCMAAALEVPAGAAAPQQQWWLQMSQQLRHSLQQLTQLESSQQQQQQQQRQLARLWDLSQQELHAGIQTVLRVLQLPAGGGSDSHMQVCLVQCLQVLAGAAACRAPGTPVQALLPFLLLAQECAQLSERDSSTSMLALGVCLQQLQTAVLEALLAALPTVSLQDFAAAGQTLSRCGFLSRPAAAADGGAPGKAISSSSSSEQALAVVLSVLEQQLLLLERVMLQEQQLLLRLQQQQAQQQQQQQAQQQQQQQAPAAAASPGTVSVAAQDAAPHMVRLLAAFATCSYRPAARCLRQMLRVVEFGIPALSPHQLSVLAKACSVLQLGFLISPGFSQSLQTALEGALKTPEQLQQELDGLFLQQQQAQQQQALLQGSGDPVAAAAAVVPAASHLQAAAAVTVEHSGSDSRTSSSTRQDVSGALARPVRVLSSGTICMSATCGSSSSSNNKGAHQRSVYGSNSGSGSRVVRSVTRSSIIMAQAVTRCGVGRPARALLGSSTSSSAALRYSHAVLMSVKALHTLSSGRVGVESADASSSSSKSSDGVRYATAYGRSCRVAVGKQLPRSLAAAAFKATAAVAQLALQPVVLSRTLPATRQSKQQQQQQQQRVAFVVPLLRLLAPLGGLLSADDLKSFTRRVGPLLGALEGRDKTRAWRAMHAVLQAYRAGRELRAALLQQRRQRQVLRRPQQATSAGESERFAAAAAVASTAAASEHAVVSAPTGSNVTVQHHHQQQQQQQRSSADAASPAELVRAAAAAAAALSVSAGPPQQQHCASHGCHTQQQEQQQPQQWLFDEQQLLPQLSPPQQQGHLQPQAVVPC